MILGRAVKVYIVRKTKNKNREESLTRKELF